jgi:tellurite resistance protein TerC
MSLTHDFMGKPLWIWGAFLVLVAVLMALDLGLFRKEQHEIGMRESLTMYGFYMTLACAFGAWVWYAYGAESGANFFTGYFIEQSLSMDNLFVMSLIFSHLAIPRLYQHRVLFWGILGVIVLRGVMIVAGVVLIQKFSWILFIFAAFLIYTGFHMAFAKEEEEDHSLENNKLLNFLRKRMRLTTDLEGNKFFVRRVAEEGGKAVLYATPLFLALVMIELSDVIFAVDSIPAIFAITTDPFIIFTSNLFAILGLRSLYFALAAVVHRFVYVKYSLAMILSLIGAKIFYGEITHDKIDPVITLSVTFGLLALGIIASMLKTRQAKSA